MKLLITGTSGQLGSYLAEHFMDRHEVIGIDIAEPKLESLKPITRKLSVLDYENLGEVCSEADTIIHCAAQVSVNASVDNPIFDARDNILGTINMLWAALKCGVGRFVYISSAAIYGDPEYLPIDEKHPTNPMSPYGLSKLTGERYTLLFNDTFGLNTVAVRPFNIYSERQDPSNPYTGVISKFIERISEGQQPIVFGDGEQTRDFIHVKDVVRMIALLLDNDGANGVYNCATGIQTSVNDLARLVGKTWGQELEPLYEEARKGDILHSYASIYPAKKDLEFEPTITIENGIAMMHDHLS
jgi:UDP-glucose 4-epimerase